MVKLDKQRRAKTVIHYLGTLGLVGSGATQLLNQEYVVTCAVFVISVAHFLVLMFVNNDWVRRLTVTSECVFIAILIICI